MLTSISPLGERARHNRWGVTVAWYIAGSLLAAAAAGAALGTLGGLAGIPLAGRAGALAVLALAAAAIDGAGLRVPGWRRQVDEDWLNRYRGWVYGVGFGAQLGLGAATIVTTATVWLYLAATVLAGGPGQGLIVGLAFGLVRALPLLGAGGIRSFPQLQRRHVALVRLGPPAARLTAAAAGAAAVGSGLVALRAA